MTSDIEPEIKYIEEACGVEGDTSDYREKTYSFVTDTTDSYIELDGMYYGYIKCFCVFSVIAIAA